MKKFSGIISLKFSMHTFSLGFADIFFCLRYIYGSWILFYSSSNLLLDLHVYVCIYGLVKHLITLGSCFFSTGFLLPQKTTNFCWFCPIFFLSDLIFFLYFFFFFFKTRNIYLGSSSFFVVISQNFGSSFWVD